MPAPAPGSSPVPGTPRQGRTGFAVKPVLTGRKVVLRPFTAEDTDTMAAIIDDPEVLRYTFAPRGALTRERLLAWYGSRGEPHDRLDLAVTDRASGELVGESVLYDWREGDRSCLFRILLGPRGRDRGLGTETVRLMLAHAFERLGLNRVELGVYSFNHRARRAYEKAGFVVEGVRREASLRGGEAFDEMVMSVLAREWREHRGYPGGTAKR
ncbi:acetyltransferase [Streptomyces sulfonofaciens]|uniref:Acetyltransferase n=1 Tax=Streptomyces sulfonofaciens TaxID=68272 RepID=A0A919GF41_9ACTN|nr:acetyltransferase [Streptomyces sulfonofaciens]